MGRFAERFAGRLKPGQLTAIQAWWRARVEGDGAS